MDQSDSKGVVPRRQMVRLARRASGRVYQPPAGDDWGTIARIYDLEHPACRGAELAFWSRQAQEAGGDVLELAAGSGRVAIALARKGCRVTGLELSEGMLERARSRTAHLLPEVAARLTWVRGDMAAFDLPSGRFGLVFVAFNSFWLLTSRAAQRGCLDRVARHLAPGGRLVLDLFPPNADDYGDEAGITQFLPSRRRGEVLLRVKDYRYDAPERLAVSDVRYYAGEGGEDRRARLLARFRYCLRLAEPGDVGALLADAGYRVVATYGTYDGEALGPDTPRAIFVAERR